MSVGHRHARGHLSVVLFIASVCAFPAVGRRGCSRDLLDDAQAAFWPVQATVVMFSLSDVVLHGWLGCALLGY